MVTHKTEHIQAPTHETKIQLAKECFFTHKF